MLTKTGLLLCTAALAGGCVSTDSEDIKTSGMFADLNAVADGSGTTLVSGSLKVGGEGSNTFVDIRPGSSDRMVASDGAETQDMVRHELAGAVWYETSFDGDDPGSSFTISFLREMDESAPDSVAALPDPFEFLAGIEGGTFSRESEDVRIEWDPAGGADPIAWWLHGDCFLDGGWFTVQGDPGLLLISRGTINPVPGQEGTTCTAELTVERRRAGNLDSSYGEGGKVFGKQTRKLTFRSAP